MNWRSYTKRLLALVLSVVMVVGLIPATVFAADADTDYLFFATDRHTNTSVIGNIINNMETYIGENELDYLGLGGDMVGSGNSHPTYSSSTVLKEVTGATTSLNASNVDIVAGIHDMNVTDDAGIVLPYSGGGAQIYEGDKYYVYGVEEYCISENSNSSNWSAQAEAFVTWANGTNIDKSKVIVVLSHYPLHAKRDDNDGAYYWHQALNKVATGSASGGTVTRNVFFFHGHNHTKDQTEYVYNVGETMKIQNGSSTTSDTIYYTYATAGYLNQNSKATLMTITDDAVTLTKYSTSGSGTAMTSVERVNTTPTLSSIAISGTTEYTVGDELDLTVTATYSDGSNKDVTADATLSGYDMSTAGTQTVTATYEGKTATTSITVTKAAAAESIDVTGTTRYTVGESLALTVTVTYDNGNTADVTADATFSGCDLTASGYYTVTATYGELTDTIDVTVAVYDEDDAAVIGVEAVSQGATELTVTWDDEAETVLTNAKVYSDFVVYDLALTGHTAGNAVEYSMFVVDGMDTTNLAVYHVAEDGTLTAVDYVIENECVVFTTDLTGTFAYGAVTVPVGYTLDSLKVTHVDNLAYVDYFVGDVPHMGDYVVTAVYTKEGAEDFTRVLLGYEENNNPDGYETNLASIKMTTAGSYDLTVTYGGKSASFPIRVWGEEFTVNNVTVHVGAGEYGVTNVSVTESTNANVATAIANLIESGTYKAYDIKLVYTSGYSATEDTKTVTLPIPEGVTNPVVYYVSNSGTAVDMKATNNGDGTVTFTTTHFSTYVVGEGVTIETESGDAITEGTEDVTTTTKVAEEVTVYKLVTSITSGKTYLIVNSNSGTGYGLENGTTGYATTAFTGGSDYYSTWDDTSKTGTAFAVGSDVYLTTSNAYEWTVGGSAGAYTFNNDGTYLRLTYTPESSSGCGGSTAESYELDFGESDAWAYTGDTLQNGNYSTYYLNYSNNTWSVATTGSNVYFYEPVTIYKVTEETETTPGIEGGTYTAKGNDITDAVAIKDQTVTLSSTLTYTTTSGTTSTPSGWSVAYEVVTGKGNSAVISKIENGVATLSGTAGTAVVKVTYTSGDLVAWDEFIVTATAPDHYSIQLHEKNGDTYGNEITAPVALKGVKADDTYSVWAVVKAYISADDTTGTDIGTLGDALHWSVSDESIATINEDTGVITFTGENYGTFDVTVSYEGADGKVITDTITISATKSQYIVPGDGTDDFPEYPNEGAVRFDKTATAVGNYSETGIAKVELSMTGVPYTTDNAMDVVVMLDMTGSMSDDGMEAAELATIAFVEKIVKNEDGSYNNNRIAVYAFNSGSSSPYELVSLKSISSDAELTTANTAIKTASDKQTSGGTPFDEAAQKCYDVLQAAKTNLPEGETTYTRQQFCVFMSDGGPTSYAGDDGDGTFTTITNSSSSGTTAITTYFSGYNSSTSSSWSFTLPTEYYTNLMKADGVTVYTVGLLLQNKPSNPSPYSSMSASTYDSTTDSLTSIGSHYYFTSRVLKQMASDESKYIDIFNVDNADKATAAFEAIAQSILEAAKDVVVEDKIGSDYTINFSIPGYGTDAAVSSEALDGLTEFYIQAVEYQLDANKNRSGDPAILENFTFNSNGTLKSHTVDGVACSNCSHVTTTNGVITAIDGTYFDYKSDSTGEYLTWEADKLTTTELALQYFAYLDNSSGLSEEEIKNGQQVKPGTYYTNEYATLTYTNFHGKQVQQEFPVPQMTWNGAQVSYVFYLVNAAGQPVNTAGRVVPFSEAVYVTEIYTHNVIWNDLEQSTSLDAVYLAQNLIPDVYELYDDDASYSIHVYEDESAVNLNNHFIISGDVTDDYNATWTNANTTYVFNTKADTAKYNAIGAYIANDGNDSVSNKTYHCKSETIVGATYTTSVDAGGNTVYTVTSVGDGYQKVDGETQTLASSLESTTGGTVIDGYVYYVDDNGEVYTIVTKTNGSEVRDGFDFHNTTVAFAVVWKPQLETDTVVVDYGLDVVIDVSTNDALASGVVGVRTDAPANVKINVGTYDAAKAQSVDVYINANHSEDGLKELKIGTASVENMTSVRFSLDKTVGMQFSEPAIFYYEADANYYEDGELQSKSMYSSVIVIPASTVYYEDSFVTFEVYTDADDTKYTGTERVWTTEGSAMNKVQDVDRPGEDLISNDYDANNPYGYDSAYESMTTYSMGSARKLTVDETYYGLAKFSFYGTGFDLISLTSNQTGTIVVQVTNEAGSVVKSKIVDTYYGYTLQNGEWVVSVNDPNAIYQVPVITVEGLDYGKYDVVITTAYNAFFAHNGATSYDFYLDAIRIYDPVKPETLVGTDKNDENVYIEDIYQEDGEYAPNYQELRDKIIKATNYTVTEDENGNVTVSGDAIPGIVFIDSNNGTSVIADYVSYGPNNELYLANGQAIAFNVAEATADKDVQLGIKSANSEAVTYSINGESFTVNTATDMYYSIAEYAKAGTVVIKNVSGGILSLTNIKVTDAPVEAEAASLLWMDGESATFALRFLSRSPVGDGSDSGENEGEDNIPEDNTNNNTNTNTGNTGNNGNADAEQNGTVSGETIAPESNGTVNDAPETDKPAEEQPEEELPKEEIPEETPEEEIPEDSLTTGTVTEQLGFWARLWNAIKNAFKRLFTSLGF